MLYLTVEHQMLFVTVSVQQVFDEAFRKPFPAVTRWYLTIANQPNVQSLTDATKLCSTALKFTRESLNIPAQYQACGKCCVDPLLHANMGMNGQPTFPMAL